MSEIKITYSMHRWMIKTRIETMAGNGVTIKHAKKTSWATTVVCDYYSRTVGFGLQKLIKSYTMKRLFKMASVDFN